MIQILELFGGIGSPRCALRNLGIPIKAIDYVEIDKKAVRSYNAMFKEELEYKTQSVVGWNLKPDMKITKGLRLLHLRLVGIEWLYTNKQETALQFQCWKACLQK